MARVVLENLSKNFAGPKGEEVSALKNASLVVEDKEFLVLVGPSGCGKSTTLRLIAGLEEISKGTISIDGQIINDVPPRDRDVAMVFQNYALYPHMTVFENMAFGLKLRKYPKAEIQQRVKEAAEILGLVPCLDRLPGALSGGQRQRVAVGRAIVRKPKVFLFDEPLSNLDPQMRVRMRTEISRLHARLGATMIYVTHDQVEAMTLGDRIAVMNKGVIQQVAEPMELYHHPANLFVAGFIGSPPMNLFRGALSPKGNALWFVGQNSPDHSASGDFSMRVSEVQVARLAGYSGKQVILGLRPDHIAPAPPHAPSSAEDYLMATVEVIEALGSETYLYLTSSAHSFVARVAGGEKAQVSQEVFLQFDLSKAHFFDPATELAIV